MGQLTDRSVKSAGEGKHVDGDGLILVVSKTGRRKWVLRFQMGGTRRDMGLGSYPAITLAAARIAASGARTLAAHGQDPILAKQAAKKAERPVPTFEEIAALVIEDAQKASSNAKVRYQWARHLGPAYCEDLLAKPVHEITTTDVAAVLRAVWTKKPAVANKLYPAIRRVFERARIILRDDHNIDLSENPARWADLKAIGFDPPEKLSRGSHPSLSYIEMSAFASDLRIREAMAARALEFLILTNVRTDAVLKARWDEFDLTKAVWTVPLIRLKDRKQRKEAFRIPLPARAIEILVTLGAAKTSPFFFPSHRSDRPLSNMAMLTLLKRMNSGQGGPRWVDGETKRPITAHGFRATFRTWAEEATGFPHAVIEEAMGHQIGTAVERAYRRTDVLEKRRKLMDAWGAFMMPKAANVVPIPKKTA